jgi:thiol-disulfide isomerase/thioredoxin
MKKILGLLLIVVILTGGALYTISAYNKSNLLNNNDLSQNNLQTKATNKNDVNEDQQKKELSDTNSNTSSNGTAPSSQLNNKIKRMSQDFKLKDLDGKEISLSSFKGKKVFLNFWATWCPPCQAEMPEIEKLYQETKTSDLVILAVDLGEDKSTAKAFIDKNKYTFKILLDTDGKLASDYNISSIPSSYFIDKDGYIVATHLGSMNLAQMKSYINLLDK